MTVFGSSVVSIIIPVYNSEEYLEECVTSLFNQTYSNIEYIFINDGSTDNSLSILKENISKYPKKNCILINSNINEGSSCARIKGIEAANGDYITFCDSDDWIEKNGIEKLVFKAMSSNADIVTSPFFIFCAGKRTKLDFPNVDNVADLNDIPLDFLHLSLCNKLIKSEILKNKDVYPIPKVDCWEDLSIITRILSKSPTVSILNEPYYNYRDSDNIVNKSLSHSSQERLLKDHLIYADFLDNWFKTQGHEFYNKFTPFLEFLKFTAKIKMLRTSPRQYRRWKETYPETNRNILKYKNIPLLYRIMFFAANIVIR